MKKWMAIFLLLAWIPVWGTTYYVDFSNGVDTQNGQSSGAAWKHAPGDTAATGTAASAALTAGDTVRFKGGVVYLGKVNIKWSGVQNNSVVYDGNSTDTWGVGRAVIDGSNLLYYGLYASAAGIHDVTISFFEVRSQVFQTGAVWVGGNGIRLQDCSRIIVADCYLHDMGYWNNDGSVAPAGCGVSMVKPVNCLITGCDITKTGGSGIGLNGAQDCIISHNRIHDYINWGVDLGGDHQLCTRNVICDNTIYNLYRYDSGFWGGSGESPHQDFIFIRKGSGTNPLFNVVERNLFYNNCDFGSTYGGTAMTFLSYADSTIIRNNVYINAHSYSTVSFGWTSAGTRFYNNTIYCPRTGAIGLATNGNNDIRNNLIVTGGAISYQDSIDEINLVADYNYFCLPVNDQHAFSKVTPYTGWSFLQWQARGYDAHSRKNTAVDTVRFVNTNGYPLACQTMDLHLLSGSPAINAGVDLSGSFTNDKDSAPRPQGGGWDVGAYEYTVNKIADFGARSAEYLAGLPLLPNPVRVALISHYLQAQKNLMVYDLAGNVVRVNDLIAGGIYIVQTGKLGKLQRLLVTP
jgi:hypothetical protein